MNPTIETPDAEAVEAEAKAAAHLRDMRSRKALGAAPGIIMHIRSLIDGATGHTERGVELAEASTPLITQWVDDADDLYAQLLSWVSYWVDELHDQPPAAAPVAWRNFQDSHRSAGFADAPQIGFRPGTTPDGAQILTRLQSMWLLTRADRIAAHSAAGVYQDDVARIVFALKGRYPTAPRPERSVSPRPCPACGEFAVSAEWIGEDVRDVLVKCENCGYEIPTVGSKVERWLS